MHSLLLAALVALFSHGARASVDCTVPFWTGVVCDATTKTCGAYPITECPQYKDLRYFLSLNLASVFRDGWTLLVSPYAISCNGSDCWTLRNISDIPPANRVLQSWSVPSINVPFSAITIRSAVPGVEVNFVLTEGTAAINSGIAPLCNLMQFAGYGVSLIDMNITVEDSCANATASMTVYGEDEIVFIFTSSDASDSVLQNIHISGATSGVLMRPAFEPMSLTAVQSCVLPTIDLSNVTVTGCTATNSRAGSLSAGAILVTMASFTGDPLVSCPGQVVLSITDYVFSWNNSLSGDFANANLSLIFSSYRQLTETTAAIAASCSDDRDSSCDTHKSAIVILAIIVTVSVIMNISMIIIFLCYGHMRLRDIYEKNKDGKSSFGSVLDNMGQNMKAKLNEYKESANKQMEDEMKRHSANKNKKKTV